jgi:nitrate reductase NapE
MRSWLDWLNENRKRQELTVFLVLTLVLAPALAVATVGSYGLGVWVYQMVAGPPSSPAKAARTPGIMRE